MRRAVHHLPSADQWRLGYTLIELVASVAATGILLAGMGSVMFVAARSTDDSATPAVQIKASATAHEILSDLQFAKSFAQRSPTAVQFSVADRDANGADDKLRYAWSGVPGDPLTRQHNDRTAVDYLDNVHVFNYTDHVKTVKAFDGTQTQHVFQSDLRLQIGIDPAAQVFATVKILNAPKVLSP